LKRIRYFKEAVSLYTIGKRLAMQKTIKAKKGKRLYFSLTYTKLDR